MKKILFVCLGNICRSPAAEAIFRSNVEHKGLSKEIIIESAAMSSCHVGEFPDQRMIEHAKQRGITMTSKSRKFLEDDFFHFDYIVAMDKKNIEDLNNLDNTQDYRDKILLMTDYCKDKSCHEVPDPYYGEQLGFDTVLDILQDASAGLLSKIEKDLKS